MVDFVTVSFDGSNSVDFVESMAKQMSAALEFGDHGHLTADERVAFLWGFRYGLHNMMSLLDQASRRGEKEFGAMSRIFSEAIDAWDLKMKPEIAMMIPTGNPDKETP